MYSLTISTYDDVPNAVKVVLKCNNEVIGVFGEICEKNNSDLAATLHNMASVASEFLLSEETKQANTGQLPGVAQDTLEERYHES